MTKRRVAVTGVGMVTSLGHDAGTTWRELLAGKSGIRDIQTFDASRFPAHVAAEVKNFDPAAVIKDKKLLKNAANFVGFALAAAQEAMEDAGVEPTETTAARWGSVVGSGMMTAEFEYWTRFYPEFAKEGELDVEKIVAAEPNFFTPSDFAKTRANSGLGLLMKQHDIRGYSTSVHTACASGGQALGLAMKAIRRGDADFMLTGGFDSMINPVGVSSFCLLGALSSHNTPAEKASRPFDLTRDGFVLGEGAAFLVFEEMEHAKKRGAKIYAEIVGDGNSLSAYRITDSPPDGNGPRQSVENALRDARLTIEDIDYINAHGTGTKMNDLSETNAIKAVFGDRAYKTPMSSTKSQLGHMIAAAGAVEGAFCALAIHHGKIPMTAHHHQKDPECDLDYVIEGPRDVEIRAALSNSFGFGGTNSSIVFKNVS